MPEPWAPAFSFLAAMERRALDLLDLECSLSSCCELYKETKLQVQQNKGRLCDPTLAAPLFLRLGWDCERLAIFLCFVELAFLYLFSPR
jgi:hypothetical protein